MKMTVSWDVARPSTRQPPEDRGRQHIWNIGQFLRDYMAQHSIIHVDEILSFGVVWISRSMPTFRRNSTPFPTQLSPCNLPECSLLVCILSHVPSLKSAFTLQILYKPSASLHYHFIPWRWRQCFSETSAWPTNPHVAKTQDFNNMVIIAVRTLNLIQEYSFHGDSMFLQNSGCLSTIPHGVRTQKSDRSCLVS
jgi:hypothetical protein